MIVINCGILLIVLSFIFRNRFKPQYGFLIVFVIMAFQSNIDGDFAGYMREFDSGYQYPTADKEPVWQFLYTTLRPIGSLAFNILLTLFELTILLRLIKKYSDRKYIFIAAVLFYFTNSMMLIYMKAIRQTCAISFCLIPFLFDYTKIKRHRWIYIFVPAAIAYGIHNSSLIALLFLILLYLQVEHDVIGKFKIGQSGEFFLPIIATVAYFILYLSKTTFLNTYMVELSQLMAQNDMRLSGYADMSEVHGEIGDVAMLIIYYDALIVFLGTWFIVKTNPINRILGLMTILASFLDMLFFGMGALMRVGYYFSIVNIAVLPSIAATIRYRFGKSFALLFVFICISYAIKTTLPAFTSMDPNLFGNYKFIFFK